MKITRILLTVLYICASINLFAQNDTTDNRLIYSWKINHIDLTDELSDIDTSLKFFQNYNAILRNQITCNYLGNLGSPLQNHIYFNQYDYGTGFVFSEPYSIYFHSPKNQQYYNTKRQFTVLNYSNAGKKEEGEQTLGVLHTQNVNEYFNVGIDYDMISSEGRYQNQQVRQNNITLFSSYRKERYNFHGNFSLNRVKAQENGGIDSLKYLGSDEYKNRRNIPVKLTDATSQVYATNLYLVNEYKLGKVSEEIKIEKKVVKKTRRSSLNFGKDINSKKNNSKSLTDSVPVIPDLEEHDSVYYDTSYVRIVKFSGFSISHEFTYNLDARKYFDNTLVDSFYNDMSFYIDSTSTSDKVYQKLIGNKISLHYKKKGKFKVGISLYSEQVDYMYAKPIYDTTTTGNDTILKGDVDDRWKSTSISGYLNGNILNFALKVYGEYYIDGDKSENSKVKLDFKYLLNQNNCIGFFGNYRNTNPDYFYEQFSSNHFLWKNNYLRMQENWDIGLNYRNSKYGTNIKFIYGQISNLLFFNQDAIIDQYRDQINIISGEVNNFFKLGSINSYSRFVYQKSTNDSILSILSIPNYSFYQSLFYEKLFNFKSTGGHLLMQFGIDYRYTSGYLANSYMPLSGLFYNQYDYRMQDYHRFDLFINFSINRANLFLRYDYLNSALNENYYYNAPFYPSPQPVFKFGVAWLFYN
jgi:hypothetical protein